MATKKVFEVAMILSASDKASRTINAAYANAEKRMKSASAAGDKAFNIGRNAGAAGLIGVGLLAGPLKAAADMEKLNVSLKTAFQGNDKAAADAYKNIVDFAAKTPYEMNEVTTSFIKLKNMGLDPGQEALTAYGNTASAMGKSLNDMIEAVADAATGEFERLKEFGIKAKSEGDRVTFTFQGVKTTVGKNSKEIEQYLKYIGNVKFKGGIEAQSKTLYGMFSTLKDGAVMAAAKIGTTLMPRVKALMDRISPLIDKIAKWIENNPKLTGTILKVVVALTALSFAVSIGAFVFGGLAKAVSFVMAVQKIYIGTMAAMKAAQMAYTFTLLATGSGFKAVSAALKIMNLGFLTSPIFWIAIALVAVVLLIVKYWEPIKKFFAKLWDGIKDVFASFWGFLKNWGVLLLGPIGLVIKYWDKIPGWFKTIWDKVKGFFLGALAYFLAIPARFLKIGGEIISGIWEGMKSKAMALFNYVKELGNKIAGAFKSVLGIASPSKVFMQFGTNITEGASKGIQKGQSAAVNASRGMGKSMTPSPNAGSRGGGGGSPISVTFAPVITGGNGSDIAAEIKKLMPWFLKELESAMARKQRLAY